MQIARAAAAGTHGQFARYRRFRACCKSRSFFMAHMHPLDAPVAAQAVVDAVEAVAGDAPNAFDACIGKRVDQKVGDGFGFCHGVCLSDEPVNFEMFKHTLVDADNQPGLPAEISFYTIFKIEAV